MARKHEGPSVWVLTNSSPKANSHVEIVDGNEVEIDDFDANDPKAVAMTVTASSIVKNGQPTKGQNISLTVAHFASPGFNLEYNEETGVTTITRTESRQGRGTRKADPTPTITNFVQRMIARKASPTVTATPSETVATVTETETETPTT